MRVVLAQACGMLACKLVCLQAYMQAGGQASFLWYWARMFFLGGREGHMLVRLDLLVGRHTEDMGLF